MNRWEKRHGINRKTWAWTRLQILEESGWRCSSCGGYGNEVDHVIPLSKGGGIYDQENLQVLCRDDHIEKTAEENRNRRVLTGPESAWGELVNQIQGEKNC